MANEMRISIDEFLGTIERLSKETAGRVSTQALANGNSCGELVGGSIATMASLVLAEMTTPNLGRGARYLLESQVYDAAGGRLPPTDQYSNFVREVFVSEASVARAMQYAAEKNPTDVSNIVADIRMAAAKIRPSRPAYDSRTEEKIGVLAGLIGALREVISGGKRYQPKVEQVRG